MLTPEQTAIVKATVPLLETGGEALTTHFYRIMLSEHGDVRPLFNQAHQASGDQPRALANAVLRYARHIDDLGALGSLPAQIIQKHVALQVLPEHYPIVGSCLLRAIREVLGEDIATDAVIEAWAAAYGQLADILIGAEGAEYDRLESAPGGWRGARPFRIAGKVRESAEITSFHLEPTDGGAVVDFQPGQYLGLRLTIDGNEVRRNYSLSQAANGRSYRISVKREEGGLVSNHLHALPEGAILDVFPPAGEFVLKQGEAPLVLISGGVGITPTLAMAEAALAQGGRDVTMVHFARDGHVHAFGATLDQWQQQHPRFAAHVVYESPGSADVAPWPTALGRAAPGHWQAWLPEDRNADVYYLGPKPFMAAVRRQLLDWGMAEDRLTHEFFGPAQALA